MKTDFFGYLPYESQISFTGGKISPRQDFSDVVAWVNKHTNLDGFLYPPNEQQLRMADISSEEWQEVPNSQRPAFLHRIPPSHELCLDSLAEAEDARKSSGSFIIHLLAYLFGVRLQFYDWWFDGRIPVKSTHHIHLTKKTVEKFLSHCYQLWKSWAMAEQKLITNILYMHSRVPSYEWDWERFMIEYMVLDGCWKVASILNKLQAKAHKERIRILCQEFGIPMDEKLITDIVTLRTDLFHETLWDKSQPCTATNGSGFAASLHIRKLNQRLIPAILEYDTPYVRTPWWIMGTFSF